ncbi:hypothetical protein HNY73_013132 [Argiope bruennichi]|uniref:Uncharacterized protein n=1 Tax=Argiope bruennichi TaxID=94029 RepID=A0A8T0F1P3_ARGBR|nr:hypothetical protein HNY73_013132 [Argiope bruennichi]
MRFIQKVVFHLAKRWLNGKWKAMANGRLAEKNYKIRSPSLSNCGHAIIFGSCNFNMYSVLVLCWTTIKLSLQKISSRSFIRSRLTLAS